MLRKLTLYSAVALGSIAIAIASSYVIDMRRAYARVSGKSTIIPSPFGALEYTAGGDGPAVLVIHGAGGGYDQGELLAEAALGGGFHSIAPSRFGYLGSEMPERATWDDQAHAYAFLLDHLGIEQVAVVALSQGGPSALLFALLYPERVSSLTCLSCGIAPSSSHEQADADQKGNMLRFVYSRDFTYWPFSKYFRPQLMGLLGANRSVVAGLTPEQRELLDRFIDFMNPASLRSAGVVFDNEAVLPGERIASITTPVLIVHASDDMLQLYRNAAFASAAIPGARLLSFEAGGHVVLAVERDAIRTAVRKHVMTHE
jgi:2-hydroxy-6-oxonona-2,4-dienedioate hydrolase